MDVTRRRFLAGASAGVMSMVTVGAFAEGTSSASPDTGFAVTHSDAEWQRLLTPAQYNVLRNAGTETPFTSPLDDEHRRGVYGCAGCGLHLFSSDTKFDSGTGWPSFWKALDNAVLQRPDAGLGVMRTEVLCSQCGGHLGHVFNDGPRPTGLRYCMNGVALTFQAL